MLIGTHWSLCVCTGVFRKFSQFSNCDNVQMDSVSCIPWKFHWNGPSIEMFISGHWKVGRNFTLYKALLFNLYSLSVFQYLCQCIQHVEYGLHSVSMCKAINSAAPEILLKDYSIVIVISNLTFKCKLNGVKQYITVRRKNFIFVVSCKLNVMLNLVLISYKY
jgi:hypothetical protein